MMKRTFGASLLILILAAGSAWGQSKTGTSVGAFMGIEPGVRFAGMGNAGVGVSGGLASVYYNPAALGALERPALQFTHSEWFAGIDYDYAAGALPVGGWGTFSGSLTSLSSGDILVRTVDKPLGTGEYYTVEDLALGLGFGRQVTQRFSAGLQLNYIHESIWHSTLNVLTLNVGTIYRLTDDGVMLGASLSNFGTRGRFAGRDLAIQFDGDPDVYGDNSSLPGEQFTDRFPVPILFRVGLAWPMKLSETTDLLLAVDAFHPSDNTESVSEGVEWTWKETLALRAGYQNLFQEDSELGWTLGVGLRGEFGGNRFLFDYAWADHDRLQETHRMSFAVEF